MIKEILKKNISNIISKKKKSLGGSLRLKFRSLCLKIKKTGTAAGKESFSNILGESK